MLTNPVKSQTLKRYPCVDEQVKIRFPFQDAYKMQMVRSRAQPIKWRLANQELAHFALVRKKIKKILNAFCPINEQSVILPIIKSIYAPGVIPQSS